MPLVPPLSLRKYHCTMRRIEHRLPIFRQSPSHKQGVPWVSAAPRLARQRIVACPPLRSLHPGEHDLDLERLPHNSKLVRPRRIILIRHGESEGNRDPRAYVTTPDWKIRLTRKGHADSLAAGLKVKELVEESPVYIYTSPYLRTKQTLSGIVRSFGT